jgi:hypothetical protein
LVLTGESDRLGEMEYCYVCSVYRYMFCENSLGSFSLLFLFLLYKWSSKGLKRSRERSNNFISTAVSAGIFDHSGACVLYWAQFCFIKIQQNQNFMLNLIGLFLDFIHGHEHDRGDFCLLFSSGQ